MYRFGNNFVYMHSIDHVLPQDNDSYDFYGKEGYLFTITLTPEQFEEVVKAIGPTLN